MFQNEMRTYRQAFATLERDYLSWIDECLTQQVQNMNHNRNSSEQFQVCFLLIFSIKLNKALKYSK